ncbi:hypothetical protein CcaCcLH18_12520 [Colletotrichum camelliae]|nr:hypothetical protein CcaCcLH18_12520 [Colletotrichum camelliae]
MLATATSATQYCNGTCNDFDELVNRLGGREAVAAQVAMDLQGNPRIPSLKHTPGYNASNPEKWFTVRWNESVQEYSSLVGRRYSGLSSDFRGNVTFTMNTSYTEVFDCSQWICQDTKHRNTEVGSSQSSFTSITTALISSQAMQKWFEINYIRFDNRYNTTLNARPYNNASSDFFLSELYKRYYCRRDLGIEDLSFAMDATSTFVTKDRGYPISTYPNSTVLSGNSEN